MAVNKKNSLEYHLYLFHEGTDSRAYEFMGSHFEKRGRYPGVVFRVWAPGAKSVSVIGDFNEWNRGATPMKKISVGVWEVFVSGLEQYSAYKYCVETSRGKFLEKSDPYAFHAEVRPKTASKAYDLDAYEWRDDEWIAARSACPMFDRPMNIYELHPGSWRLHADGSPYSYAQLAAELIPYVKDLGFTHIELMPVMEFPFDGSWGYQCTGYFAATSRYGTPADFMAFVDACHDAGIAVILDWVPAHFPKDGHGLMEFDGTCCYEYSDAMKREHPDWGTRVFDYGRNEVRSFLMSSAVFWFEKYHIDGLRVDAVASMLYLDYARLPGQWRPNKYGGRENLEAVDFLQRLNEAVFASFPNVLMIAEESTAWANVTKPTYLGGVGFSFKWNMGWMNDIIHYLQMDPVFRQFNHKDITFSLMYAFSENYILPISHDEVVHGKGSLLNKMPGFYDDKFAGTRSFYSYMMAHPGKKMIFMGSEFGQFIEWAYDKSMDWHLLEFDRHRQLLDFFREINRFYLDRSELWEIDYDWKGFDWLCCDDFNGNTIAFSRKNASGGELLFVANFSPVNRAGYQLGVPLPGAYRELLNSDDVRFGGWGNTNPHILYTENNPWHGKEQSIKLTVPPYGAVFLERVTDQ